VSTYTDFVLGLGGRDSLNLVHQPCGQVVCRVNAGDDFSVLLLTVHSHLPRCLADRTVPPKRSTAEQRARLRKAVMGE